MALRRGVFNLVGGFSEGLGHIGSTTLGCEETELCIRYNIRRPEDSFVLVRDAVVFLQVPEFRFTWNYFLRRCWSEGLSKAALASLVGQNAGLSAERRHIAIALPLEVFSSLRQLVVDPINATKRITSVIVGALVTMAGFLRGTRVVRRSPISVKNTNLHPERENSSVQVSDEWRPISIVQVDVDLLPNELRISDGANNRVWVETTRQGQVIGRQIIWAQNGKVLFEDLEEVTRRYKSRECSFVVMADDLLPPISVVIPTICRFPDVLNRLVASLALMDYPKFEIIVVDNRVMPATDMPDFGSYKNVKVVAERIPGASAARNRGIQESSYEIVAFTDDDVLVDQRWLRAIGGRLVNNPEISAIGGLVLPAQLETLPQLWFEEYFGGFSQSFDLKIVSTKDHPNDSLFPYAPGAYVAGCNMAFRKSTLQALGGFRLALGPGTVALGGEDLEIFVAIASSGATVAFEPAALIRHLHRQTEEEFMLQVKGYGLGLTAMYMSLVLHNPWHLVGMLRHAWQGSHSLKKSRTRRSPSLETTYPEFTSLIERRGMLQGPLVYLKSWTTFRLAKDEISKQFGNSVRM